MRNRGYNSKSLERLKLNLIYFFYLPINIQCSQHVETNRLIFIANQLTGFYVTRALVIHGLRTLFYLLVREIRL